MNSIILSSATRFLMALLLMFSVFLLLRGHNEPGGGFAGGLVAAASFALYALAGGVREARELLRVDPRTLIGTGLLVAVGSGLVGYFYGYPFLSGVWDDTPVPVIGKFGTPLVFDLGVYLLVTGFTLHILFTLFEES